MPVDGFAWVAQRKVTVPTLDGQRSLRMQREQRVYRLAGEGFPVTRRGPRGDLLVTLEPVFAESLSADQEILIDQLLATATAPALAAWQRTLKARQRRGTRARAGDS